MAVMHRHGGELERMVKAYGIPREEWLDLSTGINPHAWPVPPEALTEDVWRRLPEPDDGLTEAAAGYYGVPGECLAALPGSQAGIERLPALFPAGPLLLPDPTYSEHGRAWREAGHRVVSTAPDGASVEAAVYGRDIRYAVVVNPNNPTGDAYPPSAIRQWAAALHERGGCLVVDEAFADGERGGTCLAGAPPPGLIVLRSVGKFFGLAGLRLGFAVAQPDLIRQLSARSGPWAVSHPARAIGRRALADRPWQRDTRAALTEAGRRLRRLLEDATAVQSPPPGRIAGCALFQSLYWPGRAAAFFEHCARRGVYVRLFAEHGWVRIGLPAGEGQWRVLQRVVSTFK